MIRNSSGTERAAPFPLLPQAEAIPCQGLMLVRLQGERAGCEPWAREEVTARCLCSTFWLWLTPPAGGFAMNGGAMSCGKGAGLGAACASTEGVSKHLQRGRTAGWFVKGDWKGGEQLRVWDSINANQVRCS